MTRSLSLGMEGLAVRAMSMVMRTREVGVVVVVGMSVHMVVSVEMSRSGVALEKKPEARYQTGAEFVAALFGGSAS